MISGINNIRFGKVYKFTNKPDKETAKKAANLFVMVHELNKVPVKLVNSQNNHYVLTEEDVLLDQDITNKIDPKKSNDELQSILDKYDKLLENPVQIQTPDLLIGINRMFKQFTARIGIAINKQEKQEFIKSFQQSETASNSPFDKKQSETD